MNNKLEIRYRNQKQSFEILDDSLFVNLNTIKHQLEYKIPFEEIKNDIYSIRSKGDKKEAFLYTSIFFNIVLSLFILFENYKIDLIYVYSLIFPLTLVLTLAFNEINKDLKKNILNPAKFYILFTPRKTQMR